jgi:hypothetical protein
MRKILILALLTSQFANSQIVNIPDSIFKSYVLSKCDTNNDGNVQIIEASLIDSLLIQNMGISDLTGMEHFINLIWIQCDGNSISALNTSSNPSLRFVVCVGNQITSIDVSNNPLLYYLDCRNNKLNALNFRNRSSGSIPYLDTRNNQNLFCVSVDDSIYADSSLYFFRDTWTNYSTNCSIGIEENILPNASLYPNPTNGNFYIDLGETRANVKTTILNSLGTLVQTQDFESTNLLHFDLDASTGVYYIQIETSKGESKSLKVIKE